MTPETKVNGVNLDLLFNTIDLLKEKPELAKFKFRATNEWLGGTHSRATVKDFFGPGKEDASQAPCHLTWMSRKSSWELIRALIPWSTCWWLCQGA
jgi:hypothetical protein